MVIFQLGEDRRPNQIPCPLYQDIDQVKDSEIDMTNPGIIAVVTLQSTYTQIYLQSHQSTWD